MAKQIELLDCNGNRRAYCDDAAHVKREKKRLAKEKPEFAPFYTRAEHNKLVDKADAE